MTQRMMRGNPSFNGSNPSRGAGAHHATADERDPSAARIGTLLDELLSFGERVYETTPHRVARHAAYGVCSALRDRTRTEPST